MEFGSDGVREGWKTENIYKLASYPAKSG